MEKTIETIQQEQPAPTCKSCGFYENNCPFIRDTFKPYPNKACKDYTYSAMKEQEQADVDLEKEVKRWKNKYGVVGMDDLWLNFARHFYELGQRTKYQQDRAEFAKLKAKEWQSGYDEGYMKAQEQPETDLLEEVYMRGFAQGAKEERESLSHTMLTYAADVFSGKMLPEDISYSYRQELADYFRDLAKLLKEN